MDALSLIRLHLELECIGINERQELVRIPCQNPDTLHRVYVARHASGDSLFFQAGLDSALRKKLSRLPVAAFFEDPERVREILAEDGPSEDIHIGRSYIFPETLRPSQYPDVVRITRLEPGVFRPYEPDTDQNQATVFAILFDGQVASTCESSRENEHAGEAWVRTRESFRRRGFARQVTAAWAHHLIKQGKVPYYSHKWENFASQAVAQSLGLIEYMADAGYA